jgi:hypothetical protein
MALLAALLAVGVSMGDEASARKAVEAVGGRVAVDRSPAGKPVVTVSLSGPKVTDAVLERRRDLQGLRALGLFQAHITDAGLAAALKACRGLETLDISWTPVTDAGLAELKRCTRLRALRLRQVGVTDAGLKGLKGLARLETLYIFEGRITDAGLKDPVASRGPGAAEPAGRVRSVGGQLPWFALPDPRCKFPQGRCSLRNRA